MSRSPAARLNALEKHFGRLGSRRGHSLLQLVRESFGGEVSPPECLLLVDEASINELILETVGR